ncbi:MAG: SPOR domain-containing protein [Arsenophonus sp.]
MDDFKPERDIQDQTNFRPDTSDRPILRSHQQGFKYHLASNHHIMIGIAILILLLLIITIISTLKAPPDHEKDYAYTTNELKIDISKPISLLNESLFSLHQKKNQAQSISKPSINNTTTESSLSLANRGQGTYIKTHADVVVTSLEHGQTLANIKQQLLKNPTSTPSSTKLLSITPKKIVKQIKNNYEKKTKPIVQTHLNKTSDLLSAPASNYTLQLSSASRSNSLEVFAKNNHLTNYKIYKSIRNGQPWYILIDGNYRSVTEAKNAISTFPASVQKKKPWVRKFQQVKQDQK